LILAGEQGAVLACVAFGMVITFRFLDFPDLTVDGSFTLGGACAAVALVNAVNPLVALILAFFAGAVAGLLTATIHARLGVSKLLSGILVMVMLYSINLRILGGPNLPLLGNETVFTIWSQGSILFRVSVIIIFIIVVKLVLDVLSLTDFGVSLRAIGDNPKMAISLGVNKDMRQVQGLALANGLVASGGALYARLLGFADIGMGFGMLVVGLGSLLLGEAILRSQRPWALTTAALLGSLIYQAIIALALRTGLSPIDLKLTTALLVLLVLTLPKMWRMHQ